MIGNRGYARFVHIAKGSIIINQEAVDADARLDGKFVLTTNTNMPASDVAMTYKSLLRVERTFREQKTTFDPNAIMDHHNNAGLHIGTPKNSIKSQHCGFDQVGFYLLRPRDSEAAP